MHDTTRRVYALADFTVQKRPDGWYFSLTHRFGRKHRSKGPYRSIESATLMIARELKREITKRDARNTNPNAIKVEVPVCKDKVRDLNDAFRRSFSGGLPVMTIGVQELSPEIQAEALRQVTTFDAFTEDNDPHQEHDFGSFEISEHTLFWKIDYYDHSLCYGSSDPADPEKTCRVLTLMLSDEY